jgi:hypothetical protein
MKGETIYDVCIVGAGPAGLACLSAIQEPFTLDTLSDDQVHRALRALPAKKTAHRRVCVVDPNPTFMCGWKRQFDVLQIKFLRSPALAHPDFFDQNALLAYARQHGREDELLESGCARLRSLLPLGQSQIGLWKLPSTQLFQDFCRDLLPTLRHEYRQGTIVDLQSTDGNMFCLTTAVGQQLHARTVILAMGAIGKPVIPAALQKDIPQVHSWMEIDRLEAQWASKFSVDNETVMVVGGGLTAVQAALRLARIPTGGSQRRRRVILSSRRPLVERHFDLGVEWFDRRTATKCVADFYHQPVSERLAQLRESRGGGSVPPIYMAELRKWERQGRIECVVGSIDSAAAQSQASGDARVQVTIESQKYRVDAIVLACGNQPDCLAHSLLLRRIQEQWPVPMQGGFPCVTEDLRWSAACSGLYVVGGLASLNVGPDASNLMGIRRAASIVSYHALACRSWLREAQSPVLANRFHALWSDSESECEFECTCESGDTDSETDDSCMLLVPA